MMTRPGSRLRFVLLALGWAVTAGPAMAQSPGPVVDASPPTAVVQYGPDSLQWGALRVPEGSGPFPVAVLVHGGCWRSDIGAGTLAPMAVALTDAGIATWDIEYRRLGHPGAGWPGTFLDVGRGVDQLRSLARSQPLDLDRVVVVGHSSGAHLALWAAGRPGLPANSEIRGEDPLPVRAAVGIDGPVDLLATQETGLGREVCGRPVVEELLGGTPQEVPERYVQASPARMPRIQATLYQNPAALMLDRGDPDILSRRARETGERVVVHPVRESDHMQLIDPGHPTFQTVFETIREALRQDPSEVAARGAAIMPFDLDRTTHVFDTLPDGGRQQVVSDDGDSGQISLIRGHLAEEAARFSRGDFHDPGMIHGQDMAGLHTLMMAGDRLSITYREIEAGGEILYASDDPEIVAAVHAWFAQQLRDHGAHARGH